ncbi:glycosyltransferase [Beggiatoa alba]|nr:glycosyltransferase [Beggiatoa alba]
MDTYFAPRQRFGDHLIEQGLLPAERLDEALKLQQHLGLRLGDIILIKGWIDTQHFYCTLADYYQKDYVKLRAVPANLDAIKPKDVQTYAELLMLPWQTRDGATVLAVADPSQEAVDFAQQSFGKNIDFVITSKLDIIWQLRELTHDFLNERLNTLFQSQGRLGDSLIEKGMIQKKQLQEALKLHKRWGSRLGDIILHKNWVDNQRFYENLATHYQRPFINLQQQPADTNLINSADVNHYAELLAIPWQCHDGMVHLAVADPSPETITFALERFGNRVDFVITSKLDIFWQLQTLFPDFLQYRFKRLFQSRQQLGQTLVEKELISDKQRDEALALQRRWGSRLGDVILSRNWMKPLVFYETLALHYQRPFINLLDNPPDRLLLNPQDIQLYADLLVMPWKYESGILQLAIADPSPEALTFAQERFGNNVDFVITSKFDIIWVLQNNTNDYLNHRSVNKLAERKPEQSALQVFTLAQLVTIGIVSYLALILLTLDPISTLIAGNALISLFLVFNFGLRFVLTWVGGDTRIDVKVSQHEVNKLRDQDLPTYTILVPMYQESDTLPILTSALRRMDYPLSKLDIKLILEEDDEQTIETAKALGLEGIFEIIRVPDSLPKTKPKACNYALHFARGEYVTIYDAEDKPEPDQLKKVVAAFAKASDNTVCIQARLNYFNKDQNWLTRMFTLEYSLWFDFYLPALEVLKIPIPLGGTSNHFKMKVLREVDAWDPFNVTEDADLGVRLTQLKYRVGVVNSTTFEEANSQVGNWIRQRSRWIKGYMQTYLVHMRNPYELYATLGHVGFWGFQFLIGGTIINALLAPFLYGMYVFWLVTQTSLYSELFPSVLLYISLFNLMFGNAFFIYVTALGAFKRRYFDLIPYALTVPVYWLMMSVAAYKALWQLIHKPFYWEKTTHGLSNFKHSDLDLAERST